MVARLAGQLLARVQELNAQIDQLEADLGPRVGRLAPSLLALRGCGVLTAAKLVGETADIRRFHSKDALPLPRVIGRGRPEAGAPFRTRP